MIPIKISEFENKRCMLDYIYNDLGCTSLEMCYSYVNKEGNLCFSKWISYWTLMHLPDSGCIPELFPRQSKRRFLEKASHRSVLDIELMIDVDSLYILKEVYDKPPEFKSFKEKAGWIYQEMKKSGLDVTVHFTGNKSYHVSVLIPKLREMSRNERRHFKEQLLMVYGGDMLKASERTMIALEGMPSRVTGKDKIEVDFKEKMEV